MVVYDDDVALHRAPVHLGDEAALPLLALLSGAAVGARIELLPELIGFRQLLELGAVAAFCNRLPLSNLAILLDLLQSVEHRLIREVLELLPAEIVVAPLHVADPQLAQVLLQEGNVFEEELLLKVLGAGGNN